MTTKLLNRNEYLDSVTQMDHLESLQFAKQAMDYWDDFYSWNKSPCLCLEEEGEDVCYLFYHISKDKQYLSIHNILTPHKHRLKGYGKKLLTILFNETLYNTPIQRVKMFCVTSSLKFYMKLGIDFWGVNHLNQFYTDFPMPTKGIEEIPHLMKNEHLETLDKKELTYIYDKLKNNGKDLDRKQTQVFIKSLVTLGERYRFKELFDLMKNF